MLRTPARRPAFTLIELLVVVAIIALLISIMMPSLGKARKLARTTLCGTNLRSIDQAMQTYAAEWSDAILGNAHTTAAFLYNGSYSGFASGYSEGGNVPYVISSNDWLSPTAKTMGMSFDEGGTQASRINRFMQFNGFKAFICPENDVVCTAYTGDGGPNFPVHNMISYNTALCFQYVNGSGDNSATLDPSYVNLGGYRPIARLVGKTAEKVYMADAARWWNGSGSLAPDTNGAVLEASPGGMTSDYGPWSSYTRSYYKGSASADGRTDSMRHGNVKGGAKLASFKFNLAFFDGHVETLNGLDGADPSLWVPHGGRPALDEYILDNDFANRYGTSPAIN